MKVLFDQGVPVPLQQELPGMIITTAYRPGWSNLANGALLAAAEQAGMDVFLTTDQNLRISKISRIAGLPSWCCQPPAGPTSSPQAEEIRNALNRTKTGG